ncbi:hypothetical protein [Bartonella tribocorum]|uniref:Uncharacterized protein n=1 Tax=Bartonella tribocorum TaxID=85701 RepID=A0A2N9Y9F2_9HYPH|nr:hypothetical protein [Bartonella tribocorum]PIT68335.1 hypothetical protein CEV08_08260 [Bartonella tribocorum]
MNQSSVGQWYVHNNIMIHHQMLLSKHNDVPATGFEIAIIIVVMLTLVVFIWGLANDKIKISMLTIIIGLSLSAWLFILDTETDLASDKIWQGVR